MSATGTLVGSNFAVGFTTITTPDPEITYNKTANEYLIVFGDSVNNVTGQRINSSGALIGSNFKISSLACSLYPSVAWNSVNNEFLVAWHFCSTDVYAHRLDGS